MRISSQLNKLKEKVNSERKYKQNHLILPTEAIEFESLKKKENEKNQKHKFLDDLDMFKNLLKMIDNGATGFELAYEVEKNQYVKKLIYNGILFYNTFLEIGNQKFIEAPNVMKKLFNNFKTVEDTEKHLFMIWLRDEINSRTTKILNRKEEYKEIILEREKLKERFIFCQNCGAKNREKYQMYCEKCGFKLI